MSKLLITDRRNKIVELINKNGSHKMAQLAEIFNVSKETIRRDLNYLHEIGAVEKIHGGVSIPFDLKTKSMETRTVTNKEAKTKLSRKALEFIVDGSVIYLDAGSTVSCLAELLEEKKDLTIITNSLSAGMNLLNSKHDVYLTGGIINSLNMSLEGYQTNSFLDSVKVDCAFFGTNGFQDHKGPTTNDFSDVESKKAVLENSKMNIVITESEKSKITSLTSYSSWHNIDYLIIDDSVSEIVTNKLKKLTSVITVNVVR